MGKGIPTISYNLKYGGSVLIDRKDPLQATTEIAKVAKYISENNEVLTTKDKENLDLIDIIKNYFLKIFKYFNLK